MNKYYLNDVEISIKELYYNLNNLKHDIGLDESYYEIIELEDMFIRSNGDVEFYYSKITINIH